MLRRLLPDRLADGARDAIQRLNEKEFKPPPMRPETRDELLDYFRPGNAQLGELLGRDLSPWNQ